MPRTFKPVIGLAGLAGIALIAACAPEIEGRLYMLDIAEVARSGAPIIVPAELRIPESSEEECKKGLAKLAEKLKAITPLSNEGECVEVDNNQFSQFAMDLPLVTATSELDTSYLAVLTTARIEGPTGPGITLNFRMNRTLTEVQEAIGRGKNAGFSVTSGDEEQPKFIFTVENDMRDSVRLTPNYVFVDDKPGLPDREDAINLDRRESVKITFSDVIAAYIAEAKDFTFATVYPSGN